MLLPRDQEQLDELVGVMDVLPSRETDPTENFLYVQFAKDCLIQDLDRRAEELERLDARLRHPGMRPFMSVNHPRIVMQDVSIRSSWKEKGAPLYLRYDLSISPPSEP